MRVCSLFKMQKKSGNKQELRWLDLYHPVFPFDCLGCGISASLSEWIPGYKKKWNFFFEKSKQFGLPIMFH